jgi:hypothetical protein
MSWCRKGERAVAVLVVLAMLCGTAGLATAKDTVSVRIRAASGVDAYLTDGDLPIMAPGFLDLLVRDRRGIASGWAVSMGLAGGVPGVVLTGSNGPEAIAGQEVNVLGPIGEPMPGADLETTRQLLFALSGSGSGDYVQTLQATRYSEDASVHLVITVGFAP